MSCWRNVAELVVNTGHVGTPVPFGLPVFAKFVQAATNWSDRPISLTGDAYMNFFIDSSRSAGDQPIDLTTFRPGDFVS
jgi:hypothetical protein